MAAAFNQKTNQFPSFGGGNKVVTRKPAVDPGIPGGPSHQGKTPPRLNPTLQQTARPQPQVTRPQPQQPRAPQTPQAPQAPQAPAGPTIPSGPPMTGAPSPSTGTGFAVPPHLAAAMQAGPGGAVTRFGQAPAPTPARPTPQPVSQLGNQGVAQPSAPPTPQISGPPMSPLAAATPAQTPGAAQVFRRGSSGLMGASGGLLQGGLGVPGVLGTDQAIPTELLALLAGRR